MSETVLGSNELSMQITLDLIQGRIAQARAELLERVRVAEHAFDVAKSGSGGYMGLSGAGYSQCEATRPVLVDDNREISLKESTPKSGYSGGRNIVSLCLREGEMAFAWPIVNFSRQGDVEIIGVGPAKPEDLAALEALIDFIDSSDQK